MRLRHKHFDGTTTRFGQDLPAAHRHIRAHPRIRHLSVLLLAQPLEDTLNGVALLARRRQTRAQPPVDDLAVIVDLAAPVGILLTFSRPHRPESLAHRGPGHPVLTLNRPRRPPSAGIPADRRIQPHLRPRRPHTHTQPAESAQPVTPKFTINDFTATTPTPKFVIKRLPNQRSKSEYDGIEYAALTVKRIFPCRTTYSGYCPVRSSFSCHFSR